MSRPGLSESDVAEAIDTLKSAGLSNPSIRAIHQKLGRGSLTTISAHKRAIEAARREADGQGLPDPIVAALTSLADQLWTELTEAADERIGLVDKDARERIAAAEQGREAALQTASDAEHRLSAVTVELEEVKRKLADAQEENATISKAMIELRQQNAEQKERIQGMEALGEEQRDRIQLLLRQNDRQSTDIEKLQAALESVTEERDGDRRMYATKQEEWNYERELMNARSVDDRTLLVARTAEIEQLVRIQTSLEDKLTRCQKQLGEVSLEKVSLLHRVEEIKVELQSSSRELLTATEHHKALAREKDAQIVLLRSALDSTDLLRQRENNGGSDA